MHVHIQVLDRKNIFKLRPLHRALCLVLQIALEARSVQVVVVSFGCREGALHWLAETGCQYDMVLDPHRKVRVTRQID